MARLALLIVLVLAAAPAPAGGAVAATPPPGFPADVPLPPGRLQGTTGAGRAM